MPWPSGCEDLSPNRGHYVVLFRRAVCALTILLAACGTQSRVEVGPVPSPPRGRPLPAAVSPGLTAPLLFRLTVDRQVWWFAEADRAHWYQVAAARLAPAKPRVRQPRSNPPAVVTPPKSASGHTGATSGGSIADYICSTFGAGCSKAIAVARCESGLSPSARNGQYRGIFQLGSYHDGKIAAAARALSTKDHPVAADWSDYRVNVLAAFYLFSEQGWSPWECA